MLAVRRATFVAAFAIVALAVSADARAYAPEELEIPADAPDSAPQLAPSLPIGGSGLRTNGKGNRPDAGERVGPIAPVEGDDGAGEHFVEPHEGEDEATPVPGPGAEHTLGEVRYGEANLPAPVAATRTALRTAARSGDIEALRPLFAAQSVAPLVDPYGEAEDPVAHLKRQSGDADGREILAILLELLETGHVVVGSGQARTYVWPYFAHVPLSELGPPQYVELYRILTAIDVEEIERQGRYTFFRVGIAADGRLRYFMAGDPE